MLAQIESGKGFSPTCGGTFRHARLKAPGHF